MNPTRFHIAGDPDGTKAAALYPAQADGPATGLFVFAHGAGAGHGHPFMTSYAAGLASRGAHVVTFNFPYMEAKRRSPDRAPVLEDSFRRVIAAAAARAEVRGAHLFIGGKSMGGRMSTHLAGAPEAWGDLPPLHGVIVFGYPLRPPGGTRGDRVSHLHRITVPTLIVQGTRDSFGSPDDIRAALQDGPHRSDIFTVDGGDHSLAVPKSSGRPADAVHGQVMDEVAAWMARQS